MLFVDISTSSRAQSIQHKDANKRQERLKPTKKVSPSMGQDANRPPCRKAKVMKREKYKLKMESENKVLI